MQESILWTSTAPALESFAGRPLPAEADVVVIGGGYTGLSAALALARGGARVSVFERHTLGWGASSRNGGQVLTGLKHGAGELLRRFGRTRARELYQASLRTIECVEGLIESEKIECDYQRVGHLDAAFKPAHFTQLQRAQEILAREFDHPTRVVPPSEMANELGSDYYHGLLVDERSGSLQPAKYVFGLARAAARAGADLHEGAPVVRVERQAGGGFRVATERGEVRTREVFVATNGYTGAATPQFRRRIIPIGSYIVASEPLAPELARRLIPRRRVVFDTKNFLFYFRLSPDDRLVFGGRAAFFPATDRTVRDSARILQRDLIRVFPELARTEIAYAWGGTVGFTFDLFPHAGRMDGLWYAMGYAGHGVAMATYLGQQMAQRILGRPGDNPFEGLEFPSVPMYDGRPWFLPLAAAWYRVRDWVS